jgi:polyisoprenyl-phosphate glycosyltransferase
MDMSIVIPVYRSAKILPSLIEQLEAVLTGLTDSYEIILVNDASPDESWHVIDALSRERPAVKGLSLRRNAGQHNAIMAGLNSASGEVIVVMDDDLQHSPRDIPFLYMKVREGYDVCFAKFRQAKHAWWKRLGSRFNDLMARSLLKKPQDIYLSPFKAFSKELRDEVTRYTGPFPYLDGLLLMSTSSMASVEVDHHGRHEGSGNYSFRKSLSLWAKMATSFSVLPLRAAGVAGIVMACVGFLLALAAIGLKILGTIPIPTGWTSLIVIVLVIGGVQLLALGLIGEYLGRAYVRLNNVPQYSIKHRIKL